MTTKQKADQVRLEILGCHDASLHYFSEAIKAGDIGKAKTFETVSEFVNRVADEYVKSMPF